MIFPGSRYATATIVTVSCADGSTITLFHPPLPGPALVQGFFRRNGQQRLDGIANAFLQDATKFWSLCDANNSVVPDALGARPLVGIPLPGA